MPAFIGPRFTADAEDVVTFTLLDGKKEIEFWITRGTLDGAGADSRRTLREKFEACRGEIVARAERLFRVAEAGTRHEIRLLDGIQVFGSG